MKKVDTLCEHLNKFINTLKKERQQEETKEKYIRKIYRFEKSCLMDKEKKKVMEIYKYKETFSLRDEIGTCCNIEVEMNETDRSPFFLDLTM